MNYAFFSFISFVLTTKIFELLSNPSSSIVREEFRSLALYINFLDKSLSPLLILYLSIKSETFSILLHDISYENFSSSIPPSLKITDIQLSFGESSLSFGLFIEFIINIIGFDVLKFGSKNGFMFIIGF